jgi:hypothetical protein
MIVTTSTICNISWYDRKIYAMCNIFLNLKPLNGISLAAVFLDMVNYVNIL